MEAPPEIVARGVRGFESTNGLSADARRVISAAMTGASRELRNDETLLKEHLRVELKRFIQKRTGQARDHARCGAGVRMVPEL
jgi:hypothetical protein